MVRGFLSKEGGRRCFIIASDKNEKEQKNLRSNLNRPIIARNRTITKQRTLKHETNKTDRNPPITNHKPWPFELVQVNMCFLRGPLRWLTEQKMQNSFEVCKTHSAIQRISLDRSLHACKKIHDSLGFWIPHCGFRFPATGFRIPCQWNLDTGFPSQAVFRIPRTEIRNPKPKIPDSTGQNSSNSRIAPSMQNIALKYLVLNSGTRKFCPIAVNFGPV